MFKVQLDYTRERGWWAIWMKGLVAATPSSLVGWWAMWMEGLVAAIPPSLVGWWAMWMEGLVAATPPSLVGHWGVVKELSLRCLGWRKIGWLVGRKKMKFRVMEKERERFILFRVMRRSEWRLRSCDISRCLIQTSYKVLSSVWLCLQNTILYNQRLWLNICGSCQNPW